MSDATPLRIVPTPAPSGTPSTIPSDLVDEIALATRLGVSRSTLQSWRYTGRGPRYMKVGRLIRYRNTDVETFLRSSVRDPIAP